MLRLQSISLTGFKNYGQHHFSFGKKVTGICGNNGAGKTNLLDAIYYLCFTKSYISGSDAQCVMHGNQGFRIAGNFLRNKQQVEVVSILRETGKKEFSVNKELYARLSRHIGSLPCVMIAPDDVELILGGSEQRRRFIDAMICQFNPDYLQQLMDYNKLLQQRNGFLKRSNETGKTDDSLLSVLNQQLSQRGQFIFDVRKSFLQDFLVQASAHYKAIAKQAELVTLDYRSQLETQDMKQLLETSIAKDLLLQRTTAGIHRDELELLLAGQPFKTIASQGQRKSLLFGLKLTEFETLQHQKGFSPFLLLDDVFEKLDAGRMENLLKEVCIEKQGQVFITDTHRERLEANLRLIGADFEIIDL